MADTAHAMVTRVSADGKHIVFESAAGNLVTRGDNSLQDLVVADLG